MKYCGYDQFLSAERIIGASLPSLESIYSDRMCKRTRSIMQEEFHPAADYFQFLPSISRLKHFKGSKRFIDSFYPPAVRAFNDN